MMFTLMLVVSACSGPGGGGLSDPSSFSPTEIGVTSVTLVWTPVTGATGYTLERKEGSGDYQTLVNNEDKQGFLDEGLKANTTYTYRIRTLKGTLTSTGKTTSATTKSAGSPKNLTTLKPVWRSKTPVNSFTQKQEISAVKGAPINITESATSITMTGSGEIMYYLGDTCNKLTASVSGSGTFRVVGDNKLLWSGTGSVDTDLVGKQFVSLVFQGSGNGTWNSPTVFCDSAPPLINDDNSPFLKGRWGPKFDWGTGSPAAGYKYGIIVPTHAANMPDGTIATWAAWKETTYGNKPDESPSFRNQTAGFLWNPKDSSFTQTNNPTHDMFCAGLAVMANGDIFSAGGGSLGTTTGTDSQRRTSYFNVSSKVWEEVQTDNSSADTPAMNVSHWYGTAVALPDNRIFVIGGSDSASTTGAEIRGPNKNDRWIKSSSNLTNMFPTSSDINTSQGATVTFSNGKDGNRQELDEVFGWYPYLNVAPNGKLFQSGPIPRFYEYTVGTTAGSDVPVTTAAAVGTAPASSPTMRTWGNSIMFDEGKILVTGGSIIRGIGATNTGVLIDLNNGVKVEAAAPMRFRRAHHNTVVLPTGEVLAIGGNNSGKQFTDGPGTFADGSGTSYKRQWANGSAFSGDPNANFQWPTDIDTESVMTPELYDPAKNAWRDLGDMGVPRNYHSVGILLQDGRVLAAGGGLCGDLGGTVTGVPCNHPNGQIFEPPYLFDPNGNLAKRPAISSLNVGAGGVANTYRASYNSSVTVTLSSLGDGSSITKFSMIKLSAVTHSINTDVRYLEYSAEKGNLSGTGSSYQIQLTDNRNVLTPGYYFLFAMNNKGVPSEAKVVQVN
jgi:galactose oxidase